MIDARTPNEAFVRRRARARSNSREYRMIYVATFPAFFVAACVRRLGAPATGSNDRSLFGEAKKLASASIPMAFMG